MTLAGFSGNTDLNVRVTGDAQMEALRDWFENLWQDSKYIAEALVNELDESCPIAQTPPYLVELKALYELYYSDVGPTQLPLQPRRGQLAEFSARFSEPWTGHGRCQRLLLHRRCRGLGKTFIGTELLRQMRVRYPNYGLPLILCPAGLILMWRRMNEENGLDGY